MRVGEGADLTVDLRFAKFKMIRWKVYEKGHVFHRPFAWAVNKLTHLPHHYPLHQQ